MAEWLTACVIVEFLDGSSSNLSTGNSFSLYWILNWIGLDWIGLDLDLIQFYYLHMSVGSVWIGLDSTK